MKLKKILLVILILFLGILRVNAVNDDSGGTGYSNTKRAEDSQQLYNIYEYAYKIVASMNYYYNNSATLDGTAKNLDDVWNDAFETYQINEKYRNDVKNLYFSRVNNNINVSQTMYAGAVIEKAKLFATDKPGASIKYNDEAHCKSQLSALQTQIAKGENFSDDMKTVRNFMSTEADNYATYVGIAGDNSDALRNRYNQIMGITRNDLTSFCDFLKKNSGISTYIQRALRIISYVALALAVILGALDFAGAITSNDDAALTKAFQKFTKRLIAAALIFLTYVIVRLVLNLAPRMPYMNNKNFEICDELKIGGFNGFKN